MTEEQIHQAVVLALELEAKKVKQRLGADFEKARIDVVDVISPLPAQEEIVQRNVVGNNLSQVEWLAMESAMPPDEKQTHKNLAAWMTERAKAHGVSEEEPEGDELDDSVLAILENGEGEGEEGEGDEEGAADPAEEKKEKEKEKEEEAAAAGKEKEEKAKSWSAVKLVSLESKLTFRGSLSPAAFTNWIWYRCVRPKLEETKSKLPEIDLSGNAFGIEDVEEVLGEFMPVLKEKKDKKDKEKEKDSKGSKEKEKDKKGGKKDDKKKKKDLVVLNAKEKVQASNLIKNMVYGESGKGKTIVTGWVNQIDEKDIPVNLPWEFQMAHVMRQCMKLEYDVKKKKENPNSMVYYENAQSLADAIALLRKQYAIELSTMSQDQLLPLVDMISLQSRYRTNSVGTMKFDMLWYLQHGAHLIAGSSFMKRHKTTVFKTFKIQDSMVDSLLNPGPQLVFGIAPPGTGKTAVVSHLLNLFPHHTLVFNCAALPVVLGVGRIANSLGLSYAFVKGRRITPSYSCGRGLGHPVDNPEKKTTAIETLIYDVMRLNLERKKKRLALMRRMRKLHDLKKMPRVYLMCDVGSCAWLLRQLDPNRTILVVDEPPMGSDRYPENPQDNPLSCAMVQTMMTSPYKTIWMSATLPRVEALPSLVNSFMNRFRLPEDSISTHVTECFSTELDRGALMCGPSGAVAFPHSRCRTPEDLALLCKRLPSDPLVLKAYTERALASLLTRWMSLAESGKLPESFKKRVQSPDVKFADLSELTHAAIRSYALEILDAVACESDAELVVAFCQTQEHEKNFFPAFDIQEMLFSNAYAFPGLTLVADDDPAGRMLSMSKRLQEHMPKASDLEEDLKAQEAEASKQAKFADDDEVVETSSAKLKFSPELVIQSDQFLRKWCPNRPENTSGIQRVLPTVKEFLAIKDLPVDERWQMLALSGAGAYDPKLNPDATNPVYTQWVHDNMTLNKLACVTAGKEFTWGANVPASTVVVTSSFAERTSVAGMLQYVGRAARRGLTTHGQAVFEREEDLDRIFSVSDGHSTEAKTMERYATWWLSGGEVW